MISVIIPVFNREDLVKRAIDSVLNQTYKDVQLIIIDDGSTDKTGSICDYYKTIDSRVKIVHQENKGLTSARARGVDEAVGQYICFLDSDDYFEGDYLEKLYGLASTSQADIVVSGFKMLYSDGSARIPLEKKEKRDYNREEALEEMLRSTLFTWGIHGKIYKKEVFEKYEFHPGINYAEDLLTNWELFHRISHVTYAPYFGYIYYQHNDNMMKSLKARRVDYAKVFGILLDSEYKTTLTWNSLLKRIEQFTSQVMMEWVVSGDVYDDCFFELRKILGRVINEELDRGIKPDRQYYDLTVADRVAKHLYKRDLLNTIEILRDYCGFNKNNYIFGNGMWANIIKHIMEFSKIEYNGSVISGKVGKKNGDELLLTDIAKDSGIIVCAAERSRKEIREILFNEGFENYIDLSDFCYLLRYTNDLLTID